MKELVDNKSTSYEKEFQVLDAELDAEAALQKESVSSAINNSLLEELKSIGLNCVSEVGVMLLCAIPCFQYIRAKIQTTIVVVQCKGITVHKLSARNIRLLIMTITHWVQEMCNI